jgi:hypothetical protein
MESPVAANGGRGEYMTIPEDVEAAKILPSAAKAEAAVECPNVLRWRAIRWWAQVTVLGIFLAAVAAAAAVFLGPLVIKKVRGFACVPNRAEIRREEKIYTLSLMYFAQFWFCQTSIATRVAICARIFGYLLIFLACGRNISPILCIAMEFFVASS